MRTDRRIRRGVIAACALILSGCWSTRSATNADSARSTQAFGQPGAEPVLYARDGSVVPLASLAPGEADGTLAADRAPIHGVQAREESRMQLLDLYQRVVGEKEAFALEVRSLDAALAELQSAQAALAEECDLLRARVATLEAEARQAAEEKNDLAARLTTAQIRRLEAEKLLLETKLAAARASEKADAVKKDKSTKGTREAAGVKLDGALSEPRRAHDALSAPGAATPSTGGKP